MRVRAHTWVALGAGLTLFGCGGGDGRQNLPPPDQDPSAVLEPSEGALVFVDRETGSTFNLRGEAIDGPLAQRDYVLEQLPGVNMFWFAWTVFFPGSQIWGRSERVRAATLPTSKTGSPGCGGGADCIPSLPNTGPPTGALAWTRPGESGADYLDNDDLVIGTFFDRLPRAYPHNILWWHEIANDRAGELDYSVTFCPLTGSGVVWGNNGKVTSLGVSGNLFNSNLVMYDHATGSLWPQLWMGAVSGSEEGTWLEALPTTETTWGNWKKLHPETLVLSDDTGFSRNYRAYPYGDYRTNNSDTFRVTNPLPDDDLYPRKAMALGLMDRPSGAARAYVHSDLADVGPRSAINDTFIGQPVVVIYEQASQLAIAFVARDPDGNILTFDAATYVP